MHSDVTNRSLPRRILQGSTAVAIQNEDGTLTLCPLT